MTKKWFDADRKTFSSPNAENLAYLAVLVAVEAPARESKYANAARIPWDLVNDIRVALDTLGYDWKSAAKRRFELARERHAKEIASRVHGWKVR